MNGVAMPALAWALIVGLTFSGHAQSGGAKVPLFDNLGDHHYSISTNVPLAQRYFDQGLRLYYGFNHAEAIRAFEEATRQDPNCAMCYWGIALAYGPNINLPMDRAAGVAAFGALQEAQKRESQANARERSLIRALAARYAADPPDDRRALDEAYAREMRDVVRQHPKDLEAATLLAEALMLLSPWDYWTRDGKPREHTPDMLAQLERVMAADADHPGANHFYIHAVEAVQPERALRAAERLAGLMPGAGHLVHMPGHIYVRVGRYRDAIEANEHAVHADESYIRDRNPAAGVYTLGYYPHNYDFLAFAASMIGRSQQALTSTEKMAALVDDAALGEPGMTFLQHHETKHLQMKVRFGKWQEILKVPSPPEAAPHARGMWHYARGRALAATGKIAEAEKALASLRGIAANKELAATRLEFNTSGTVLRIADAVLAGRIAAAKKDFPAAIEHLREAARLEDEMTYGEPPEWSIPVRHELGDVLLQAGRHADAERVFREDLERFPQNGWSLRGLEQALRGQGRTADADEVARQFRDVWSSADVPPQ